ncbi:phospholipase D family protein [Azoarcus sp. DD4]|uniref:phospholipase D family protein n=1 Tax=Azoarcus sp. DD4 TaxID=2027405 RepID=UPI001F115C8E|nr:phospholipase D family protein [Azoarcus sp. DD4]
MFDAFGFAEHDVSCDGEGASMLWTQLRFRGELCDKCMTAPRKPNKGRGAIAFACVPAAGFPARTGGLRASLPPGKHGPAGSTAPPACTPAVKHITPAFRVAKCNMPFDHVERERHPPVTAPCRQAPPIRRTASTENVMAKFLNTSATNYFLEELIKNAKDRLILISPFLKLNDRMKELLADKNRLKIDVRIVYGKSELQPEEINWLKELTYIRTSFCKNLHAKCYMNEELAIITSLNLYEFSQINNNEMGVLIRREEDGELYRETYDEAQRIIRISDEVRITLERVSADAKGEDEGKGESEDSGDKSETGDRSGKLTTSKLAQKSGMKTGEFLEKLVAAGLLETRDGKHYLTAKGKEAGGEFKMSPRFGPYFLWPEGLSLLL